MGYRIEPHAPVDVELRRILHDQLQVAIADLRTDGGPDADAIHDARRRIKKARSALRLVRSAFGGAVVHEANAELRQVARTVAAQRDADARVDAIDRLLAVLAEPTEPAAPAEPPLAALTRLREQAVAAAADQRASGAVDVSTARGASHQLQQTSDWLQRIPVQAEGWDALGPGLRRQYARGRHQLEALGPAPDDEDRHEWRKRVKDLWYHERLLRDLWPKALKPYVRTASDLADLLGDDHDLSLVRSFAEVDATLDAEDRAWVVDAVDARRDVLLADARVLGRLLYAERPRAWAGRHGAWWAIRSAAGS
ncbi:MAG TPA: CHAD domain-containing protein [Acidimicrobiales bacterium]|nr:CHAD domain-containing protein [Acidimicrobiales bacterium]